MAGVEVAVVVMECEGRVLVTWNPRWGAFSLPMTKRRRWQEPNLPAGYRQEEWVHAAGRATAEVLGRTFLPEELPEPLEVVEDYRQSDADGVWKDYHFQVFRLRPEPGVEPHAGVIYEWLSPERLWERCPLSRTTIDLIERLRGRW